MQFRLKGWLRLSRTPVPEEMELIAEVLREKSEDLLSKGVPRGKKGSRIVSWAVDGDKVLLEIEGTRHLRPHDALLRIRNLLTRELRTKRIGAREVRADEYAVTVSVEVERRRIEEIAGDYAEVEEEKPLRVLFRGLSEEDLKSRMIDRVLREIEHLTEEREAKPNMVPTSTILLSTGQKTYVVVGSEPVDPNVEGIKQGWFKRFPGRGQWTFTPPAARLLRVFKGMAEDHVLIPLGFREWMFPKLMPWSVYEKMPGYFDHLAEGLMYVGHVGRDPAALEDFKRDVRLKKKADPSLVKKDMQGPTHVLAAAQCEPFYVFFGKEVTPKEELPIKAYDASGWSYRWEGGGIEGVVRTVEFFRLESVWMGTPDQVTDIRWQLAQKTFDFIDKVLDLEIRMVVGAPFYLTAEQARERLVDVSGEKYQNVPTLDIEAYVAYRGSRNEAEWLEINAISIHKLKYVEGFGIKSSTRVWTGCNGFGLTRYLAAFLARHGFDPSRWPGEVRDRFAKSYDPKPPKLTTWP